MSIEISEYEEWTNLIGQFLMSFARIEFDVARALLDNSELTYRDFRDLAFLKRANKLQNWIKTMPLPEAGKKNLHRIIDDLVKLADVRNLIAHNPVDLSLESVFEDDPWLEIRSLRDQTINVTKERLTADLAHLHETETKLHELLASASFHS